MTTYTAPADYYAAGGGLTNAPLEPPAAPGLPGSGKAVVSVTYNGKTLSAVLKAADDGELTGRLPRIGEEMRIAWEHADEIAGVKA